MTPEHKAELIQQFTELIEDPTAEVSVETGTHGTPNYSTGFMEFAPTKGRTITVKVYGGAVHTRDRVGFIGADGTVQP